MKERHNIFGDFEIKTDHQISATKTYNEQVKKTTSGQADFAVALDHQE